ncbi:hypothetical protein COCMIDRAFT_33424 [Bipolaris oryzae ATCC 44560]|uniref:Rhodopsin domain-containing protein n=1 Tax=Bipolaris oryzae ATCC 44560 TaxID=930090 RepID=W6ZGZ4_COCMI|nr:uncharacterized protein COCMIDRAFT_33424 [Bipolaris oryzae ATCC 44560]EUC49163.1 hypothetical protein COCMIDRAFT_33424 [Bipolaris oryzae ATCC 44560]
MAPSELHDVVWTKAKPPDTLSRSRLDGVNIAMLTLTSLIFAIRFILRIIAKKARELQDLLSYMAYVCYVLMIVMYMEENDPLYRAESVLRGERPMYEGLFMFLPFRITWNLRLPRIQKTAIFVLFGSGWICILFATLRVVQVSTNNGTPKIPDPKWLQMWTIIETSMAVMIGCGPAYNALCPRCRAQNAQRRPISLEDIKEPDLATRSDGETSQI